MAASSAPGLASVCTTKTGTQQDITGYFPPVTTCIFTSQDQAGINNGAEEWLDYANPIPKNAIIVQCNPRQTLPPQPGSLVCYFPDIPMNILLNTNQPLDTDQEEIKVLTFISALISISDPFAPGPGGPNNPYNASLTCDDSNKPGTPVLNQVQQVPSSTQVFFSAGVVAPQGTLDTYCYLGYNDTSSGWNIIIQYINGSPLPEWKDKLRKQRLAQTSHNTGVAGAAIGLVGAVPKVTPPVAIGSAVIAFLFSAVGVVTGDAAVDPIDPNFTVVVTPTPPNVDVSSYGPATARLIQSLEQALAFSAAIDTTQNRASGALLASDNSSQQLQVNALAGFESQLDAILNQLPAELAAYGQELLS